MAELSADKSYVTVKKGDTLYRIALDYTKVTYQTLGKWNDIENYDLIYVDQKIYLSDKSTKSTNNTSKATIKHFGLQSKPSEGYSNRTVFATWTWSKANTENYQVKWEYDTGDGVWFVGTNSTVTDKQSIYDAPTHAKRIRFTVKPISKKRTVNGKESSYWSAGWSTAKTYSFSANPPSVPGKPTISITDLKLTATIDASNLGASIIQFALHKDNGETAYSTGKASVKLGTATYEFKVSPGSVYKVQCRSYGNGEYSEWSGKNGNWSDEKGTVPATPAGFTKCVLQGDKHNEVLLEWKACATATDYEIEYTTDRSYFDQSNVENKKITIDKGDTTKTTIFNLDEGAQYFIRIRAHNANGWSGWSVDSSTTIGDAPAAPTTWSSSSSVILGEPLTLYWVHNTKDGTAESNARLRISVDNEADIIEIPGTSNDDEDEPVKASKYEVQMATYYALELDDPDKNVYSETGQVLTEKVEGSLVEGAKTVDNLDVYSVTTDDDETIYYCIRSKYAEGAILKWQVQTMGLELEDANGSYSEWSVERTVYIYNPPVFESMSISYESNVELEDDKLVALPFIVNGIPGQSQHQAPISYYISIVANNSYETVDNFGNEKQVLAGESVYTKYIEANDTNYILREKISAGDITLENNQSYTVNVTMGMNSGLSTSESRDFTVAWGDMDAIYEPNAEVIIDTDTYSASIRPFCEDNDGNSISDVTLAVYRREFDGGFTEIATGLNNTDNKFVSDPHPALDFARYRIVATYKTTGTVIYNDIPGIEVGCKAAIIQWDEAWSTFDIPRGEDGSIVGDAFSEQVWSGSMLKLPYNIDVTDKTKIDVELVSYIGRKRPVTYYGTQLGESSTWNMVVPKSDKETIYALRRLSVWTGDVYVREPSGTGYWAHVSLSIPIKHCEVTVPISIDVTRVEGGI